MIKVWPVIREAAGEARKTTAPATSRGSPIRWRAAIRSITSARKAGQRHGLGATLSLLASADLRYSALTWPILVRRRRFSRAHSLLNEPWIEGIQRVNHAIRACCVLADYGPVHAHAIAPDICTQLHTQERSCGGQAHRIRATDAPFNDVMR